MPRDRSEVTLEDATVDELLAEVKRRLDSLCRALRDSDAKVVDLFKQLERKSS